MWKKLAVISSIALSVIFTPLSVHADLERATLVEKVNVVVEGGATASQIDTQSILKRLKTKAGGPFSQESFDEDLKGLILDFDDVDPTLDYQDGKVVVTLKLHPRPVIKRVLFRGNEKIDDKTLLKELEINPQDIFDRSAFIKAFNNIKTYYVKKGYFEAELSYETDLDTESNEMDLIINIREGRSGRIGDIKFVGFNKEEQAAISKMLSSKKFNLFTSWLSGTGTYRKEMVEQDEFIILNYIQNRGFADARVDIEVQEATRNNRLNIVMTLDRGRPYTFGPIDFDGNTLYTDEEIRQKLGVKEGDPFSPDAIRATIRAISDIYGRQGYIDAYVSYVPQLNPDTDSYSVKFAIHEGPRYRVGMIKVFGNTTTHPEVILRESLLFPGEVFNVPKLQLTEQRLRNMGYFSNVNVYAVKPDQEAGFDAEYRDIHIEVEECSTGDFNFSFGFSTAESIFGSLTFTERNFFSGGIPRLWCDGYRAVRGGGEYLNARLAIGAKQRSFHISWTEPYFCCTPWSVGMDFDSTANFAQLEHVELYTTGISFHAVYPINPFLRYHMHYRLKNSDHEADANVTQEVLSQLNQDGITSAAGMGLAYDSTNHPMVPNQGFRSRLDVEYVGLGGPNQYFTFGYTNSYYQSLPLCSVLRFRADAHFHLPLFGTNEEHIFYDERFFLGGETTVRGYRAYTLGDVNVLADGDQQAVGGVSSLLGSVEWLIPVFCRADAFVFYDAGSISMKTFHVDKIQHSWGYGTRLNLIDNGPPIIIGWGHPINEKRDDIVKKFFITFGGRF